MAGDVSQYAHSAHSATSVRAGTNMGGFAGGVSPSVRAAFFGAALVFGAILLAGCSQDHAPSCGPVKADGSLGQNTDMDGSGRTPPSCAGVPPNCGPGRNEDCCESPLVSGGTFYRSYDGVTYTDRRYPATVSNFRLDRFEVTTSRLCQFERALSKSCPDGWPWALPAGAGRNPRDPVDPGWDPAWNRRFAGAIASDVRLLAACGSTPEPGPAVMDWFEAFAFCVWDGGRLPTEAEWNYAAAGGSQQRVYPWGAAAPDCTYANASLNGGDWCSHNNIDAATVGYRSPKGDGRWGHADLAGNVDEWAVDWYAEPYPGVPCVNCVNAVAPNDDGGAPERVVRGGDVFSPADFLRVSRRDSWRPDVAIIHGARCAREP